MKVEITENIVGLDFSYIIGDKPSLKKEIAEDLIKAGYATEIKSKNAKK